MQQIEQIPVIIQLDFTRCIAAGEVAQIAHFTEQAIFELELAHLCSLRDSFTDVPDTIFASTLRRLLTKSGNALLLCELSGRPRALNCVALGLAMWLLQQSAADAIDHPEVEKKLLERFGEYLTTHFGNKQASIATFINKKFGDNHMRTRVEVVGENVVARMPAIHDEELVGVFVNQPLVNSGSDYAPPAQA